MGCLISALSSAETGFLNLCVVNKISPNQIGLFFFLRCVFACIQRFGLECGDLTGYKNPFLEVT